MMLFVRVWGITWSLLYPKYIMHISCHFLSILPPLSLSFSLDGWAGVGQFAGKMISGDWRRSRGERGQTLRQVGLYAPPAIIVIISSVPPHQLPGNTNQMVFQHTNYQDNGIPSFKTPKPCKWCQHTNYQDNGISIHQSKVTQFELLCPVFHGSWCISWTRHISHLYRY